VPISNFPHEIGNSLLAALPESELARLIPHVTVVPLRARQVLYKRDEPLTDVFFPARALCSLLLTMEDGATAEIAVVGPEGVVGVEAVLGVRMAACDASVQVEGDGHALAMNIDAFRAALSTCPTFASFVRGYAEAFIAFVMQSVACNARHSVDERCCKWLLHAHDRLATDDLALTHDLLSTMLGVRRPTVTLVLSDLATAGIVSTSRGMVRIVDRAKLESRACDCYHRLSKGYSAHSAGGSKVVRRESVL
jgi:CRP-like cAMP-binding protein